MRGYRAKNMMASKVRRINTQIRELIAEPEVRESAS